MSALVLVTACTSHSTPAPNSSSTTPTTRSSTPAPGTKSSVSSSGTTDRPITISFAGDVNFAKRTATRLAANPATAFGVAAKSLGRADLTMVNLETSISVGGMKYPKEYNFQAPPSALTALKDAGIDVATMANNHAADYGSAGLKQTVAAIKKSPIPVLGIGKNADAAFAPWYVTVRGTKIAFIAADQVRDESTLPDFSAGPNKAGVANAYQPQLLNTVRAARARADIVIVYLHWGTEYKTCPNSEQPGLADALVKAGATAVVGTHAHVLLGAGWRKDGHYVAYGLSNYLWWESFGNEQDDNGILTLSFQKGKVTSAQFAAAHLDSTGVPVPAVGATKKRIDAEWERDRKCAGLLPAPPK
ncbi:MAG: CapA family protein [Jatrophihabitans sp.]